MTCPLCFHAAGALRRGSTFIEHRKPPGGGAGAAGGVSVAKREASSMMDGHTGKCFWFSACKQQCIVVLFNAATSYLAGESGDWQSVGIIPYITKNVLMAMGM